MPVSDLARSTEYIIELSKFVQIQSKEAFLKKEFTMSARTHNANRCPNVPEKIGLLSIHYGKVDSLKRLEIK